MLDREKAQLDAAIEYARAQDTARAIDRAYREGFQAGLRQRKPPVGQKLRACVREVWVTINSRGDVRRDDRH